METQPGEWLMPGKKIAIPDFAFGKDFAIFLGHLYSIISKDIQIAGRSR